MLKVRPTNAKSKAEVLLVQIHSSCPSRSSIVVKQVLFGITGRDFELVVARSLSGHARVTCLLDDLSSFSGRSYELLQKGSVALGGRFIIKGCVHCVGSRPALARF